MADLIAQLQARLLGVAGVGTNPNSGPAVLRPPDVQAVMVQPLANGQTLGIATASVVGDRDGRHWLVTNWHVLSGRHPVTKEARHCSKATPDELLVYMTTAALQTRTAVKISLRDEDGDALWLEHRIHGSSVDIAAIPLPPSDAYVVHVWLDPLIEQSPIWISIGERISVVGFPFGTSAGLGLPIWTQAFVASHIELDYEGSQCFLIDARTREGQSGAPVVYFSSSGAYPVQLGGTELGTAGETRFLGIYSGRINDESDIGRVWKLSAIRDVVFEGVFSAAL